MDMSNLRWWGWGTLDRDYPLESQPSFWPVLQERLDLPDDVIEREIPPISLEEISLRPPRLDAPMLSSLCRLLGEDAVHTTKRVRVEHAYGKSYRDLIRIRAGQIPHPPDAVIYPIDQRQVAALLSWAADRDVIVIPFGGGSSVVGGVEPPPGDRPALTLDMAKLSRVLSIDPVSRTARIQAGTMGPEGEARLNAEGFTLGHFPQSFEFSTLGGWIATRSVGQNSIGYGSIEHLTQAVRAVTPVGIIETKGATSAGPSLRDLLIGSEGTCGVITEATVRIRSLPEVQDYRGVLFRSLEDGIAVLRDLVQDQALSPSIVHLSDTPEMTAQSVTNHESNGLRRLADNLREWYLSIGGYDLAPGSSLMLLGFDGDGDWVAHQWNRALEVCSDHQGRSLGRVVGRSWMRDRYAQPYLRDVLLDRGILVDSLETATSWSNLMRLYKAVKVTMKGAISATGGGPGYVVTHISHAYETGASLHFTFLGRQIPDPDPLSKQAQWQTIKQATTDVILATDGTLTHHRGIGRDEVLWIEEEIGRLGVRTVRMLKRVFDPMDIMNPGVLLPPQEEW